MIRTILASVAAAAVSIASANAALTISFTGAVGDGVTTITFDGTTTASLGGTVRETGEAGYSPEDTLQPSGAGAFINNFTIQDLLISVVGNLTLSVGGTTANVTELFLDEDFATSSPDNDLGFRVDNALGYFAGDTINWDGSATFALDISDFNAGAFSNVPGTFSNTLGNLGTEGEITFIVEPTVGGEVPVPGALPLMLAGIGAIVARRKMRS
ncbi:MAG: PEP-CTERM sorting domain-containing protein [Pseudomonadota bacterium]